MFECSNVLDMWRDSLGAAAGILVPAKKCPNLILVLYIQMFGCLNVQMVKCSNAVLQYYTSGGIVWGQQQGYWCLLKSALI